LISRNSREKKRKKIIPEERKRKKGPSPVERVEGIPKMEHRKRE